MSVDVCYLLSHGFAARMVLQSGLVPALRRAGLSSAVVVPHPAKEAAIEITRHHGMPALAAPPVGGRLLKEYMTIRRYVFEDIRKNPSLWAKHEHLRHLRLRRRLRLDAYMALNRLAIRSGAFRSVFESMESNLLASREVREMLEELRPTLVVSTYPVSIVESYFLAEAKRLGITTVGHLLSWDNITSKGRFPSIPDFFLTWGPVMSAEAAQYYGHSQDRIYECGVAHFDRHLEPVSTEAVANQLAALKLNASDPYLFFGMSSPDVSPHEIDVVERLAQMVRADVFGSRMQMVVRPHPQNVEHRDDVWLARLQAAAGPRVGVNLPATRDSGLSWDLKDQDFDVLIALIRGCSLAINSGSTISIDAMVQDKPVILTAFDGDAWLPWHRSARRVLEYRHIEKLLSFGGISVVRTFDELTNAINAYLDDPSLNREERALSIRQECGSLGSTPDRIAEALSDILHRGLEEADPTKVRTSESTQVV